ncbi:MAG: EamA/RhaT family transporter, partial [Thermoprotei archaeon]
AYSFLIGENILQHSFNTYIYFILLALIPMIGGHTVMNYLLKYLKTSIVTSIALGEPVGASILAYYILGQEVDLLKASAMALVLFSLFLVITQGIKEKQCK